MKKILYLGLDPARFEGEGELTHLPIIETKARPFEGAIQDFFYELPRVTHIIITSRTAALLFCDYGAQSHFSYREKIFLCVGKATGELLREKGCDQLEIAHIETAEGVVSLLKRVPFSSFLLYPHSARARPLLKNYLIDRGFTFRSISLYDTLLKSTPLPDLEAFDQIIFTSPSTVEAFFAAIEQPPLREQCIPLGPVTQSALDNIFNHF